MIIGGAPLPAPLYPRGSEWRRWDLHVHTPYSALNNGFGADFKTYAARLFQTAVELQIAAIGVTDYFSIEGYSRLRELLGDRPQLEALVGGALADEAERILLLANVELRATVVVRAPDGSDSRINFHVVFSDELTSEEIDNNFLRELRFTAEGNPEDSDERWSLTVDNLSQLGRRLKAQHHGFVDQSDLVVGMTNAVISLEQVTEVLARQPSRFRDRYLIVVPSDEDLSEIRWTGQGHLLRKVFIQKANMLFSANPGTREFGLGKRHSSVEAFKEEFKSLKPCIHGSDAHEFARLFRPDADRFTWIKADPTFRGLQQLLHEPEARVFIGQMPEGLVRSRSRPTRIVEGVQINRAAGATLSEAWFNAQLPLNIGLSVVIGKKGSGKSALADVLALLGNTKRSDAFSFLNTNRFRQPRDGKADQFEATLTWADGTVEGPIRLATNRDATSVERVRYIPQNYLEEICNEIGSGRKSRFYSELQQVIFSHVPRAERLGFGTLDDLLYHLGEGIQRTIKLLKGELGEINRELAGHLSRSLADEDRTFADMVTQKLRELEAHDKTKPASMPKPEEDPAIQEQNRAIEAELAATHEAAAQLAHQLTELRRENATLVRRRATADHLLASLGNLQRQMASSLAESARDAEALGLDLSVIVQVRINDQPVQDLTTAINQRVSQIATEIDDEVEGSLAERHGAIQEEIVVLEARLTAPQQEYQKYLKQVSEWEQTRAQIVGSEDLPGSIRHIEFQRNQLRTVPERIRRLERQRDRKALEIYAEKQRLRRHYETYHQPVEDFLEKHPLAGQGFQLTFRTSVREADFGSRFLAMVNQRRIGPFSGVDEGSEALHGLIAEVNWSSARSVLRFARSILAEMHSHQGKELSLKDQLVQDATLDDVLNFIFGFEYLEPIYQLKWDGKTVDELSPGERGTLLLIFYFLIDREDIPLIIDQPEENLDNQTVVRTLVPCVKDAKERRQIVIVTHNPNLAVVCDADQVVYAEMHKDLGNEIRYESGSIEDPTINRRILDVLEGTRPAFDQRDARYLD